MAKSKLKQNQLNFFEVIAMSVAIMAPTFAMASNTPMLAGVSGYSLGLAFIITMLVVGLVSISFIKFNQKVSAAGSVYSFTNASLGSKAGTAAGWAMSLTYTMFAAGCVAAFGTFASTLISGISGAHVPWLPLTLVCAALIWFITYHDVSISTIVMLVFEGASILLLLVLAVIIIAKVGFSTGLSVKPFTLGNNHFSGIGLAVVFGFLSFAGFEGASSLGEESKNPKKYIPLAIIFTIIIIGCFYIVVSYAQVIGFGVTESGVKELQTSSSPLTALSEKFVSKWFSELITLGAAVSAFTCALGSASGACRIVYSMSNDGKLPGVLSKVHPKFSSPHIALHLVMVIVIVVDVCLNRNEGITNYSYLGTVGSLAIILSYLATVIGSMVYFRKNGEWKIYHLILPVLAVIAILFTLYSNVYPIPSFPFNIFPYIVLGVIALGSLFTFIYRKAANPDLQLDQKSETIE